MPSEHKTFVTQHSARRFTAVCSCGWHGRPQYTQIQAHREAREHRIHRGRTPRNRRENP